MPHAGGQLPSGVKVHARSMPSKAATRLLGISTA